MPEEDRLSNALKGIYFTYTTNVRGADDEALDDVIKALTDACTKAIERHRDRTRAALGKVKNS